MLESGRIAQYEEQEEDGKKVTRILWFEDWEDNLPLGKTEVPPHFARPHLRLPFLFHLAAQTAKDVHIFPDNRAPESVFYII